MNKTPACIGVLTTALLSIFTSAWAQSDDTVDVTISAQQPLGEALQSFADQADLQVIFFSEVADGKESAELSGEYEVTVALDTLLADTGLTYTFLDEDSVSVQAEPKSEPTEPGKSQPASSPVLMAQNQTSATQNQTSNLNETTNEEQDDVVPLEEIIVVGSHIRGVPSASPVIIFDEEYIKKSGFSTTQDLMRSLPQNFGGGPTETSTQITTANDANLNIAAGAGINLRGLGADSTLVLLSGRRFAPAGRGAFADISMIPITAIERVEILTDGASAIYGSDAVGGVVNFIMSDKYDGAETRLRYGNVTDGAREEIQIAQTLGTTWESGNALLSYEYYHVDALDTEDRSFSKDAFDPFDLIPEQERNSVFLNATQDLSGRFGLFANAFYSERDSKTLNSNRATMSQTRLGQTEQYGGTLGSTVELGGTWVAELAGTYNYNETKSETLTFDSVGGDSQNSTFSESTIWSVDANADGALFRLAGGDVKAALGGHYREESFKDPTAAEDRNLPPTHRRDIVAAYAEVFFPFVSDKNQMSGVNRLEVTLAGRFEDYSDFGSSTDPKIGLIWSPVNGLNLRGTWGTSFRAPLFREMVLSSNNAFIFYAQDPTDPGFTGVIDPFTPAGGRLTMIGFGPNTSIQPEEATTWTAGLDIEPPSIPGLSIKLTYYDINFEDRIAAPSFTSFFTILGDPIFDPLLVSRAPDPATLAFFAVLPNTLNFTAADPLDAEVYIDGQIRNLTETQTTGIDLAASYTVDANTGTWDFTLNGSYLIDNTEQLVQNLPDIDQINVVAKPIDLKIRGGVSWSRGGFGTNLSVDYVDSYKDIRFDPIVDVTSWTTVDLNVSYDTGDRGDLVDNTVFSINVRNLFDKDPPFVGSFVASRQVNFDSDNASPLGRFISLQISKNW